MPHISVKLISMLTDDQKRSLANKMADSLCETIGAQPDHISVSIEEYEIEQINEERPTVMLKMLEGRSDDQKREAAQGLADIFYQTTKLPDDLNVMVADFTPEEWQDVYAEDIKGKDSIMFRKPNYNPKDLLK